MLNVKCQRHQESRIHYEYITCERIHEGRLMCNISSIWNFLKLLILMMMTHSCPPFILSQLIRWFRDSRYFLVTMMQCQCKLDRI